MGALHFMEERAKNKGLSGGLSCVNRAEFDVLAARFFVLITRVAGERPAGEAEMQHFVQKSQMP